MIDIQVQRNGFVAVLEIRRGPANFFDRELLADLADAAAAVTADGARAVVLCAEGKHFCAGADFSAAPSGAARADSSRLLYAEAVRIFEIAVPVVAAVQGAAVGGGLGLALAADFRVAGPAARFQANFARLGFHQGFGLSITLPLVVGHQRATEMLYSGRAVHTPEALEWGLADRWAEAGAEREVAMAWAAELAGSAPLAVRSMKQTLRGPITDQVRRALDRELAEQARLWETEDSRRGIEASRLRQAPDFIGR
ncbi:Enoyl-CoA hydratase/carnithine racemase [Nakamurella panacisegetis]|uniref:Enoyl-CoA hydratase/carnithine racemase n=1 Tax=Nakamurella panacisegetis TaxID=1090615 RepID=A0A1H0LBK8_9ACTN|nr:enoyl-CoA hydratase/isomerase family protein [Nakamurella panacisegetis]SDO65614.1 Enoyl-CoA hydratase/carnithine racemase [Nakamurella panacisegetis]